MEPIERSSTLWNCFWFLQKAHKAHKFLGYFDSFVVTAMIKWLVRGWMKALGRLSRGCYTCRFFIGEAAKTKLIMNEAKIMFITGSSVNITLIGEHWFFGL